MFGRKSNDTDEVGALAVHPVANQSAQVSPIAKTSPKSFKGLEGTSGDGVVLIGKGTRMIGEISDCTVVEIQGVLEGTVTADAIIIREGGGFKGDLQTGHAEVHGVLEGTVTVHGLLDVRSTGHVSGELAYEQFAVSVGANVTGNIASPGAVDTIGTGQTNSQSFESNDPSDNSYVSTAGGVGAAMSNGSAESGSSTSANGGGLDWNSE